MGVGVGVGVGQEGGNVVEQRLSHLQARRGAAVATVRWEGGKPTAGGHDAKVARRTTAIRSPFNGGA